MTAWSVPRDWPGETVFVLGGGPSLIEVDISLLKSHRVIAVNEAGLTIAPWCDVLYYPDARWMEWNFDRINLHTGKYRLTRVDPYKRTARCNPELKERITKGLPDLNIRHLQRDRPKALSPHPTHVAGADGGSNAVNIAFHFGAARIVLVGFDMKGGSFHNRHLKKPQPGCFDSFARSLTQMGEALEKYNVEVLNATLNSALTCFRKVKLKDVI